MKVGNPKYQQINIEVADLNWPDHLLYEDCISVNSSDDLNPNLADLFNTNNKYWYPSQVNTADFKNYISYQFKEVECLTGLIYGTPYTAICTTMGSTRYYHGFSLCYEYLYQKCF